MHQLHRSCMRSNPASVGTVESEGRQMKQSWIYYVKKSNFLVSVGGSTARLAAVYRSSESCGPPVVSQLCRAEDIQLDQLQPTAGPDRLLQDRLAATARPAGAGGTGRADRRLLVGRGVGGPGKLATPLVHHKEYTGPGTTLGGRRSYL